jgi:hypothetical protein
VVGAVSAIGTYGLAFGFVSLALGNYLAGRRNDIEGFAILRFGGLFIGFLGFALILASMFNNWWL